MSEPRRPWWDAKRPAGFRLSATDVLVLLLCALITWVLWPVAGSPALVLPLALGHFFLFCNVFRVGRRTEMTWAALLVINTVAWHLADALSLSRIFLTQTPATAIAVLWAVSRKDYHGLGYTLLRRARTGEEADHDPEKTAGTARLR